MALWGNPEAAGVAADTLPDPEVVVAKSGPASLRASTNIRQPNLQNVAESVLHGAEPHGVHFLALFP